MMTPNLHLKSMAVAPFAPSKQALEGYLNAVNRALEIVPEIYTPCISENVDAIDAFLQANGFKTATDNYGITVTL